MHCIVCLFFTVTNSNRLHHILPPFVTLGAASTEASVNMKYNRNRNVFTTTVQIPDYDVETGIRIGMADSSSKGKALTFEITNKNIPQLSLISRAK